MRLDERIPNLVSELKSDENYPSFWPKKNSRKLAKYHILSVFDRFFFAKNRVKYYPISVMRPELESSHQGASFKPQNERWCYALFLHPPCNFKSLLARGRVGIKILEK